MAIDPAKESDPTKALQQLAPEARERVGLAFNKMIEEEVALAARRPGHDKQSHDKVRNIVADIGEIE